MKKLFLIATALIGCLMYTGCKDENTPEDSVGANQNVKLYHLELMGGGHDGFGHYDYEGEDDDYTLSTYGMYCGSGTLARPDLNEDREWVRFIDEDENVSGTGYHLRFAVEYRQPGLVINSDMIPAGTYTMGSQGYGNISYVENGKLIWRGSILDGSTIEISFPSDGKMHYVLKSKVATDDGKEIKELPDFIYKGSYTLSHQSSK